MWSPIPSIFGFHNGVVMALLNLLQKLNSDELISWAIYCVMRTSSHFQPIGQPNNIMYFSLSVKSYSTLDLTLPSIGKLFLKVMLFCLSFWIYPRFSIYPEI